MVRLAPATRDELVAATHALGVSLLVALCLALGVALVGQTGPLKRAERSTQDRLLRLARRAFEADTHDIVLVTIDEDTLEQQACTWPPPHRLYGRLIETLRSCGPKAVGLAVQLDRSASGEDQALERMMQGGGVILARSEAPFAVPLGSSEVPVDADGMVRHFFASLPIQEASVPCLALAMLRSSFRDPSFLPRGFAGPPGTSYPIAFAGVSAEAFETVSAARVLSGQDCTREFRDRYVLVGPQLGRVGGTLPTPCSLGEGESRLGVQAHILYTLVRGERLHEWDGLQAAVLCGFVAALVFLMASRMPVFVGLVFSTTLLCLFCLGVVYCYLVYRLCLPVWMGGMALGSATCLGAGWRLGLETWLLRLPGVGKPSSGS